MQREAGPRIVKPAEANEIFKKKKTESESEGNLLIILLNSF